MCMVKMDIYCSHLMLTLQKPAYSLKASLWLHVTLTTLRRNHCDPLCRSSVSPDVHQKILTSHQSDTDHNCCDWPTLLIFKLPLKMNQFEEHLIEEVQKDNHLYNSWK